MNRKTNGAVESVGDGAKAVGDALKSLLGK